MASFPKSYQTFSDDVDYYKWYSFNSRSQDRNLLRNSSKEYWMKAAEFIQEKITDDVIEKAFAQMPNEVKGETNDKLIATVKKRRDNLFILFLNFMMSLRNIRLLSRQIKMILSTLNLLMIEKYN